MRTVVSSDGLHLPKTRSLQETRYGSLSGCWRSLASRLGPYENGPGTPCAGMMGLSKKQPKTQGEPSPWPTMIPYSRRYSSSYRDMSSSLARKHKSGRMSRSMSPLGPVRGDGDGPADRTLPCGTSSRILPHSRALYHLGVGVVTRSSLARVNAEKPWEMYEELQGDCWGAAKRRRRDMATGSKLFSVDSTTIDVSVGVSVGEVPADEGGRRLGPRGVSADVRSGDERRRTSRRRAR